MPTKIGIGPLKRAMQKKRKNHTEEETATAKLLQQSLEQSNPEISAENEGQLSVDVYQTNDTLIIMAPIAGVEIADMDITVSDDTITIRGKRKQPENLCPETFMTQECFWGNFSRTIILPQNIDTKKIRANFKSGILTIKIPKMEKRSNRVIKIQM